ncbi:MAG: carbohydrate ABC transporter permease [Anaerolineae bacterium]
MYVRRRGDSLLRVALLTPPLLFLLSMVVYPLLFGVRMSLTDYKTGQWNNFHNFLRATQDSLFSDAVRAITVYVTFVIVAEFLLGLILALVIYHNVKSGWLKALFYFLFLMPLVTPPVAAGVLFRLMYTPGYGIINYLLQMVGLIQKEILWLSQPVPAMFAVISVDVWQWTPFVFFVFFAGLQAVPKDTVEAAAVDGASGLQRFRWIELPYLRPLMLLVLILRLADTFQVFDHVMVLTQGGPGTVTQFLSVYVYKIGFKFLNLNYAAAASIMIIVVVILIFMLLNRLLRIEEGIEAHGP